MYVDSAKRRAARCGVMIVAVELALIAAVVATLLFLYRDCAELIMGSGIPAAILRLELPLRAVETGEKPPEDVPPAAEPEKAAEPEPEKAGEPEGPLYYTAPESAPEPAAEPAPEKTAETEPVSVEYSPEGIVLLNRTDLNIDVSDFLSMPLGFDTEDLTVLIIHTHATEAYSMADGDKYDPSEPYRTTDEGHNVIAVGDELERILTERGINVVHDRELYDYPVYNNSYTRALAAIKERLAENESIRVVIDLHRDALEDSDGRVYKTVADIGDTPSAQIELIAGTDYTGLYHPRWRDNLSFAMKLQAAMVTDYPTLARPLQISQYRYNQHLTQGSLIVEVGCSGNTLSEAKTAAGYFADCLAKVLGK